MSAPKPIPSRLYLLTLFYASLQECAAEAAQCRTIVQSIAGSNWRVLTPGAQVCAIGFETTATAAQLEARFSPLSGKAHFHFLLVEVAAPVCGYLGEDVWRWIGRHLPRDSKTQ